MRQKAAFNAPNDEYVSPPSISMKDSVPSQSILLKNKNNYVEPDQEEGDVTPEYEYHDIANSYL